MKWKDLAAITAALFLFSFVFVPLIQESMPWLMWFIWVIAAAVTVAMAAVTGYVFGRKKDV